MASACVLRRAWFSLIFIRNLSLAPRLGFGGEEAGRPGEAETGRPSEVEQLPKKSGTYRFVQNQLRALCGLYARKYTDLIRFYRHWR